MALYAKLLGWLQNDDSDSCLEDISQEYQTSQVDIDGSDSELVCWVKENNQFEMSNEDLFYLIKRYCLDVEECKNESKGCVEKLTNFQSDNGVSFNANDVEILMFTTEVTICNLSGKDFKEQVIDYLILKDLESSFSPSDLPDDDDGNDTNDNVYFNRYGNNGLLQYINGYWLYERSESWFELTDNVHYIFENGSWRKFDLAELPPEAHLLSLLFDALIAGGHTTLDLFGLIPGAGEIFDGINAAWYYAEGDLVNGSLATASMVPFVGVVPTGAKWSRNVLKLSDKIFESANGLKYARRFYGSLGFAESAVSHIFRHSVDDLSKPIHGIFKNKDDIFGIIDDAYIKLQNNTDVVTDVIVGGNREVVVNLNKVIGKKGGSAGDGSDLTKLKIVFDGSTDKIITSFPK